MVELALPDNFQESSPTLIVLPIPATFIDPTGVIDFYETGAGSLWRVRFVNIFGNTGGTAGTRVVSFNILTSGQLGDPWPAGGPVSAASPVTLAVNESFSFTWSTEVGDNYAGLNSPFGKTSVMGLPMVFVPRLTLLEISVDSSGALGDQTVFVQGGMAQVEKFPQNSLSGQGDQLPDLSPVWYLSEDAA
jgi:hypothetical protein